MPTIRIDPAKGAQRKVQAGQTVGAAIGKAFGGPGLVLFAAKMGGDFIKVLTKKEPVFPFEVDTDTNQVKLLAPDPLQFDAPKYRVLAPKIRARNDEVQAALQAVWNAGEIVPQLPKRYRDLAGELLSQRAIFYRDAAPPDAAPTVTEGAQYTGAYSMAGIIPPGGFAGFAQMTPASKAAQGFNRLSRSAGRRTRRKKAKSTKRRAKKTKSRKRKAGKLVKGSAAAKRFMANLRRKRK